MKKVSLSDFIYKSEGPDKYFVFNTKYQKNLPIGFFSNQDDAINAKRKFFAEKIKLNPYNSELFNVLFDGNKITGLEEPCKISNIEPFLKPYGLKIENNICVLCNEI